MTGKRREGVTDAAVGVTPPSIRHGSRLAAGSEMSTNLAGLDLRGRSFAGAHLRDASFTGSDLRGVNFTAADLRGANLSKVRCGMSRMWTAKVVLGALLLSIAIGLLSGWGGHLVLQFLSSESPRQRAMGIFVSLVVLAVLAVGMGKGLGPAVRYVVPSAAGIAVLVALIAVSTGAGPGTGALAVAAFVILAGAIVTLSVFARAVAGSAGTVFFAVVAISGAFSGRVLGGGIAALVVAIGAMLVARRSAKREEQFPLMARLNAGIASHGGTCFRGANLSGANFDQARLTACDFRGARLREARFDKARVHLCRFDAGAAPASTSRPPPETARAQRLMATIRGLLARGRFARSS